jgi:hypothetical protein
MRAFAINPQLCRIETARRVRQKRFLGCIPRNGSVRFLPANYAIADDPPADDVAVLITNPVGTRDDAGATTPAGR